MAEGIKYTHALERCVPLQEGGTVTVTIQSSEPINEADYMILRPDAAAAMGRCLTDLANGMRPLPLPFQWPTEKQPPRGDDTFEGAAMDWQENFYPEDPPMEDDDGEVVESLYDSWTDHEK